MMFAQGRCTKHEMNGSEATVQVVLTWVRYLELRHKKSNQKIQEIKLLFACTI